MKKVSNCLIWKTEDIMDENKNNSPEEKASDDFSKGRRNTLKTLATLPVLGALAYGVYKKKLMEFKRQDIGDVFKFDAPSPVVLKSTGDSKKIRVGLIGFGIRGKQLMRAAGFAEPTWIESLKEAARLNPKDSRYEDYLAQEDLGIEINGVCEIFETYGKQAVAAASNIHRQGAEAQVAEHVKFYKTYQELLAAKDIDAVIIATPDHWHAQMTIDAAKAGKHVYCEKPASWTVEETYELRDVVKETGIVFQLAHQGRQTDSYHVAKKIIEKDLLGPISLIEVTTNRNDPNGAWVYPIHETAGVNTIDWKQFEGPANRIEEYNNYMKSGAWKRFMGPDSREKFSLERFFRWRCWFDYSTGLNGDLLTHEYDAVNQLLNVGIPYSAVCSGGNYFFKDGRTVPDVMQVVYEFPKRNLSMLYSATLASDRPRGRVFMGHDASMELGNTLTMKVDPRSTRYKEKINQGIITPGVPFYTYVPGQKNVDAISSATEQYFASRGLLYTYVNGKRYDTTHLHIREWLECIRTGGKPSCGIQEAFEEAITAHMSTRAYLEGRTMFWDADREKIVRGDFNEKA